MNKMAIQYKILISVFIVSFTAFLFLVNENTNQRHEMKSDISELSVENQSLDSTNSELTEKVDVLQIENEELYNENRELKHEVSLLKNENHSAEVSASGIPENLSKYKVRIYSYNPETQVIKEMDVYLYSEGYNMLLGKKYSEKPSWMAKHPTVYYHSHETKHLAHKIAADIEGITNIHFKVKRGNGEEVKTGQEKFTIFIHYSGLN